jgi:pSer/pThr/pTyr-binding forkhead associated (FHA) protein
MSYEINGELMPIGGGDPIPLIRDKLIVGRHQSCDIPLQFPNISGRHCELNYRDGYWYIRDLNSTNGVKVNGNRVKEKLLRHEDVISISKRQYTISYDMPKGRHIIEDVEEDIMAQSLLQKAGLERPSQRKIDSKGRRLVDPSDLLNDEDD